MLSLFLFFERQFLEYFGLDQYAAAHFPLQPVQHRHPQLKQTIAETDVQLFPVFDRYG